ncbi:glycerol-3-phosphate dehydrogenase [Vibrio sp.]|uniref:glycerol-3-phosphate dehydrogenase n=1 Tax=Vibrio sp. TaxID=678 RepID=UPI003D0A2E98
MSRLATAEFSAPLDMIIVGGGINGSGIAADAAGRGLRVGLYEAEDFASATSSASSKLIHGGLRYLEHFEFRLVSEALAEREVILHKAPHLAKPMRFILPHRPFLRPAWMIRCGLFLYDHLGQRTTLPASSQVDLSQYPGMQPEINTGFEYSDCWVDDARLVLANVQSAWQNGAEISNYCKVVAAKQDAGLWRVTLEDQLTGQRVVRYCKALINAAGPWVKQFFEHQLASIAPRNIRLIKGSHVVVRKIHSDSRAFILQNRDGRIVFVIPYLDDFSLIGTTDLEYNDDARQVSISAEEIDYLLDVVNQHFTKPVAKQDIIWSFSGVRPLCDDESASASAITRDYTLELIADKNAPPLLSVFGGKLTTYRKLAEAAMVKLAPYFPKMGAPWTACQALPGGQFSCSREQLVHALCLRYPWLPAGLAQRLVNQYGSQSWQLLSGIGSMQQMGQCFGHDLYQHEVDYLITNEWVINSQDLLWRRSKLGLYLSIDQQKQLQDYLQRQSFKPVEQRQIG